MSDTSREEKTLTLSARTSGKETQEKKWQHFVLLYVENARRENEWREHKTLEGGSGHARFWDEQGRKNSNFFSQNLCKGDPAKKRTAFCASVYV